MSHISFSGTIAVWAIKETEFEYRNFTGTAIGVQAALDYLKGTKGSVFVGPGTITQTNAYYIHGGTHLQGAGKGTTVLKWGTLNFSGAAYSGNGLFVTPYGSTSPPTSGTVQSDITISDLTLDGDSQNQTQGISPGTPGHMGLWAIYAKNILVRDVEIKNFLMTGIQFDACANAVVSESYLHEVGQCTVASTRNGINFINNQGAVSPYGTKCLISQCVIENVNDAGVAITGNTSYITFTDSHVYGALTDTFEIDDTNGGSMSHISITNIRSINGGYYFAVIGAQGGGGSVCSDVTIADCTYVLPNDTATSTRAATMLYTATPDGTGTVKRVIMSNCRMIYTNTSDTATSGTGLFTLVGNTSQVKITDCYAENCPGQGFIVGNLAAQANAVSDIELTRITINRTNSYGASISVGGAYAASVKRVTLHQCKWIDPCLQNIGADASLQIVQTQNQAGATIQDIVVSECSVIHTGATTYDASGVRLYQNGAGVLDALVFRNNDFSKANTSPLAQANGTPTNCTLISTGMGANIASAATISVPSQGDIFHVTGTTNITNGITVNSWDRGRTVKLIFDSTPTVTDTGTSKLNGNFVATADDTLTLSCDGTNWFELGRSPN